jgi:hypothetical protein
VRKSPSLHGRKSNPNPKFLGTAEAYFVCHIGPNFSDFFDLCLHWVSAVREYKQTHLGKAGLFVGFLNSICAKKIDSKPRNF